MTKKEPSLGFITALIGGGVGGSPRLVRSIILSKPPGTRAKDRKRRKAERQRKKRGG